MIKESKLKTLASKTYNPSLSIYIPTSRAGRNLEDQLRFKNTLSKAHKMLVEQGKSVKEAHQFLKEPYALLDDDDFWLHLSDGLAIFIGPDFYEHFLVPIQVPEIVHLKKQFYLRPLFSLLTENQRFFLLALSQNEVRFFEGNKYSITPVIIEDLVPADMETALRMDVNGNTLQAHSGGNSPIFHGHGEGKDQKVTRLKQYFQQIDNGLMQMLHDERAPLVIASVDYQVPIYREVSKYTNILSRSISGNPEDDDPVLLHEKAWNIVRSTFRNKLKRLRNSFDELKYKKKATTDLGFILKASQNGRISRLFLNKHKNVWGVFDPRQITNIIKIEKPGRGMELLEIAAINTFMNGGEVYNLHPDDMPDDSHSANAILRY